MKKHYQIYIWKRAPFLRLLLPLATGILLGYYTGLSFDYLLLAATFSVILFLIFSWFSIKMRFKFSFLGGFAISLLLVCLGALLTSQKNMRNNPNWYGHYADSTSRLIVVLKEPPVAKAKSFKSSAECIYVISNSSTRETTGNILVYFAKNPGAQLPTVGDTLALRGILQPIKNSGNPGAFNYSRYAAFHGLFHQMYITAGHVEIIAHPRGFSFNVALQKLRSHVKNILYKYIDGQDQKTIAAAMLIGYKVDLDKDLIQAYSNAGIVHLIAISGLHMGIIYFILLWVFSRIPYLKRSANTKYILVIVALWCFAIITGLSGSVLRSAFMFSFIAVGKLFSKKSSIYNSMAASAFLLLCFNPYLLWDVGFQLSYLAVTGIVVAQKSIADWMIFTSKWKNYLWQLMSVSIAAQLFTFPVGIYYFHQFPLMFLISNLLAIPLTMVALWSSIMLLVVSPVEVLAVIVGKFVSLNIWLINKSVSTINALPFSLWDEISLSLLQTIVLYIFIFLLLQALFKRNKIVLLWSTITLLFFLVIFIFDRYQSLSQKKIVVYNVPAHRAVDFIDGEQYAFIGDTILTNDGVLRNFHLKPARISMNIRGQDSLSSGFYKNEKFTGFYGKTLVVIDEAFDHKLTGEKIKVDYLLVSKNPKLYMEQLDKTFSPGIVIFDASNPLWKIAKWKKDCERLHLRCHSVPQQGAFIEDL